MTSHLLFRRLAILAGCLAIALFIFLDRGESRSTESPPNEPMTQATTNVPYAPEPPSITNHGGAPAVRQAMLRLVVSKLGIDAPVVVLGVDSDGVMQAPKTPNDVGWYDFSSLPNEDGNIVLSGHVDFANFGPAVFWRLRDLRTGDTIQARLKDQSLVTYRVATLYTYDSDAAPVQEIIGRTSGEMRP